MSDVLRVAASPAPATPAPAGGGPTRDYDLASDIAADTPERMRALGDPLRLAVLDLVLERAMSVTELAERVRRPKGTVAYHVDVLVDAGLLRVVRTRRVRAVEERLYGRTARTIVFPSTPGEIPFLQHVVDEIDHTALAAADEGAGFTLRHARIPAARAQAYLDRLYALAIEFSDEPRDGDVEFGLYVAIFPTNRRLGPPDPTPDMTPGGSA